MKHRQGITLIVVAMMIVAALTRMHLTHNQGIYSSILGVEFSIGGHHEQLNCNCPICHAEDFVATKAEPFEYHAFITTLSYEFAVYQTAPANDIHTLSSLRGPPYLS